eukprot:5723715-Amphidinium_carterae.1
MPYVCNVLFETCAKGTQKTDGRANWATNTEISQGTCPNDMARLQACLRLNLKQAPGSTLKGFNFCALGRFGSGCNTRRKRPWESQASTWQTDASAILYAN